MVTVWAVVLLVAAEYGVRPVTHAFWNIPVIMRTVASSSLIDTHVQHPETTGPRPCLVRYEQGKKRRPDNGVHRPALYLEIRTTACRHDGHATHPLIRSPPIRARRRWIELGS